MDHNVDAPIQEHGNPLRRNNSIFTKAHFKEEMRELFRVELNPETTTKVTMYGLGLLLTPLTILGLVVGYCRAYKKFMFPKDVLPRMYNLPPIVRFAMAVGVGVVWLTTIIGLLLFMALVAANPMRAKFIMTYLLINSVSSFVVYVGFRKWRNSMHNLLMQTGEHGTARYANPEDLHEYAGTGGIYIGGNYVMKIMGHILTVAGARSGKTVNLIINALLGIGGYQGSWCVIDPKGELAAICGRALKKMGKRVVVINPWNLLGEKLLTASSYNPLDLLSDTNSPDLIDDIGIIAEMICPIKPASDHNAFFTDSARNIIAGMLLYIMCSDKYKNPTLKDLWETIRVFGNDFDELVADMYVSDHPVHGHAISNAAKEIRRQIESPETFASIMSNALEATNFLKSGTLQKSLESGFDPYTLADGNTAVFIVIPADKIKSQAAWLRLVTTSMLRAVVRIPNKRVTFVYDEVGNLGYMSEIETALAAYAGFNITMWLIYQDISQIKSTYGDKFESIIANCMVRQYFGIRDNLGAKYVSDAMGVRTITKYKRDWLGNVLEVENKERHLANPDEVVRLSKDNILLFTGENFPAKIRKTPYYTNPVLFRDGKPIFDPNPYFKGH